MSPVVKLGAVILLCSANLTTAVAAADGPIVITQASAVAGRVTPGDASGFPVTITQGGSYRLGSNLEVTAGQNGIQVLASNVSLDMDGFTLTGAGSARNGVAIHAAGINNVALRNGTITDFMLRGVSAPSVNLTTLSDMRVYSNDADGAYLGASARVFRSDVSYNKGIGIRCLTYCQIVDNMVAANGAEGITLQHGVAIGNTVVFNTLLGIKALPTAAGANNLIGSNNSSRPEQATGLTGMDPNVCAASWNQQPGPC